MPDTEETRAYIGSRNAASGRAEALLVRVLPDGTCLTVEEGYTVDAGTPCFATREEACAWARATWICTR